MKKGFTLIELLIVVIVLGILATIAVPQFGKIAEKARRSEADSNIAALETAQHMYYADNNQYTDNMLALDVTTKDNYWETTTAPNSSNTEQFYILATRSATGSTKGTTYWKTSTGKFGGSYPFLPSNAVSTTAVSY